MNHAMTDRKLPHPLVAIIPVAVLIGLLVIVIMPHTVESV